jgi:hypothetical protein
LEALTHAHPSLAHPPPVDTHSQDLPPAGGYKVPSMYSRPYMKARFPHGIALFLGGAAVMFTGFWRMGTINIARR